MRTLALLAAILATSTVASADPMLRMGLTTGANRHTPEAAEVGPMFAVGASAGRFSGEVNYALLSFMDPDTRIQRLGVALRTDVTSWWVKNSERTLFVELGAARRWGSWRLGDDIYNTDSTQNEVHVSFGLQLEDKWHLALRLGASRLEEETMGVACRGIACMARVVLPMPEASGLGGSIMIETLAVLGAKRSTRPPLRAIAD